MAIISNLSATARVTLEDNLTVVNFTLNPDGTIVMAFVSRSDITMTPADFDAIHLVNQRLRQLGDTPNAPP